MPARGSYQSPYAGSFFSRPSPSKGKAAPPPIAPKRWYPPRHGERPGGQCLCPRGADCTASG
jgi:hypothetical protein